MKLLITTLLSLVLLIGNTNAEEGSYDIVYVGEHDLNSVNTPEGTVTGGKLEGIFKVTNSTGKLYVNGDNGKSTCVILSKKNKDKKSSDLEAFCETTDLKTGDKTFSYNIRKEGTVQSGSKGKGKQTIIGGTGKFKGITGVCNYTVEYLPENRLTTIGTCNYKI